MNNNELNISVISDWESTEALSKQILDSGEKIIGMDAEGFGQYGTMKVSLVQLAFGQEVVLIQLDRIWNEYNKTHLPTSFQSLMTSKSIVKVGVDLTNDIEQLTHAYKLRCRGCIDLQDIATVLQIPDISMIGLLQRYFPKSDFTRHSELKGKGVIQSRSWDADLSDEQIEYAAIDGFLSLKLGIRMLGTAAEAPKLEPPKPEVKDHEPDIKQLYNWITGWFNSAESRPMQKVVNQIVNSYAPWRKIYIESERQKRSVEMLRQMIDSGWMQQDLFGKISITRIDK